MKTPTHDWIWPAAVIGLILFGMTMTFGILYASRVDGGPEVILDYYDKAVAWNASAAERSASDTLGWTARVEHEKEGMLRLVILERTGKPVTAARGTLTLTRPHRATFSEVIPFRVDASGRASDIPVTARGSGLWDVHIEATRGNARFIHAVRREWTLP